ncbi:MAG: TolC family protein [Gemmatimonadota bacterium]
MRLAERRRDAGDASELEVSLARVAAGEVLNQAAADALAAVSTLLELQGLVGEPPDRVTVSLADSLVLPPPAADPPAGTHLAVAAAQADVRAAEASLALARADRFPAPGLTAGVETHDPSGGESGILPLVGLAVPLPLFDRNAAAIAQARAELDRASGLLEVAEQESRAAVAAAARQLAAARARAESDRGVLDDAVRVTSLANRAYEEGAFPLASVLEAQRAARDARIRYVEDVAEVRIAEADYRLVTQTWREP